MIEEYLTWRALINTIDILLVLFLIYKLYRIIKGTVAMNIFIGIATMYFVWLAVTLFKMKFLGEILGKIISVGVLALIIVFQQEIRQFLMRIGDTNISSKWSFLNRFNLFDSKNHKTTNIDAISTACFNMAKTKTGVLMVIENTILLDFLSQTGTVINADLSTILLESFFFKNSPLHDGAVVIRSHTVLSAGAILPVSQRNDIPKSMGLRHRAAFGICEKTDAICILVSEETGHVCIIHKENAIYLSSKEDLSQKLSELMGSTD